MALGLGPIAHTVDKWRDDVLSEWLKCPPWIVDCGRCKKVLPDQTITDGYVWTDSKLADQICKARGISRERFVRSMCVPKPSVIANIVYCDELKKAFGDISDIEGFDKNGILHLPKGAGLLFPKKEQGQIIGAEFYRLSRVLRPKEKK